jgi:hypothetical protein
MTTPTLISRETIGTETYEVARALFVTSRGGCGERKVYTINRKKVTRLAWEARREAALSFRLVA